MSEETFKIAQCPTCGSPRIQRVCGTWRGTYEDQPYEVPALEYYSCPDCGEKVYPPQAMRRIEEASPAYAEPPARRQPRKTPTAAAEANG
jgi:predicted RNA-binding Zn-ribbon protein involved in translation (DUF1610 family)